jgi:histidyl-tRNA synthetase
LPKKNPKIDIQLRYASENFVPFGVIFGGSEFENKSVKVKNLYQRTEETIPVGEVVEYLKAQLSKQ